MPLHKKSGRKEHKPERSADAKSDQKPMVIKPEGQGVGFGPAQALRSPHTRQQEIVQETGRLIGNQGLMRMISSLADHPAPSVQRGTESLPALKTIISKQAVDEAIATNETLQSIHQKIDSLTPKTDAEDAAIRDTRFKGEETDARRAEVIKTNKEVRELIISEVTAANLGGNDALAKAIRRRFYTQLARIAPFYTQNWNANILGTKANPAKGRTCNVTTVAMVLEGLGKTAAEFNGNHNLMDILAASLGEKTPAVNLRFPDFLQILAIYLQMVGNKAGLVAMAGSDPTRFQEKMDAASLLAYKAVTNSKNFGDFLKMFDVTIEIFDPDLQKGLAVIGSYYRPLETDFEDYLKDQKKPNAKGNEKKKLYEKFISGRKSGYRWRAGRAGRDIEKVQEAVAQIDTEIEVSQDKIGEYDETLEHLGTETGSITSATGPEGSGAGDRRSQLEAKRAEEEAKLRELESSRNEKLREITSLQIEKAASEAVGSKTDEEEKVEEALPLSVYKKAFIPIMEDLLGSGAQVIVIIHNHFVKLQAISEENIIVHDPGGWGRVNSVISWEKARENGYFKRYNVIR